MADRETEGGTEIPWSKPYPLTEIGRSGQVREREVIEKRDGVLYRKRERQARLRLMCWTDWMPLEDCKTWEPPEVDHEHVSECGS